MKKYGSIIAPSLMIFLVIIFSSVGISRFMGEMSEVRREISLLEKRNKVLETRLSVLQKASSEVAVFSEDVVMALPPASSALTAMSQLRSEASELGLILDNVLLSEGGLYGDDINSIEISFDLVGSYEEVSAFIINISNKKPIMNLGVLTMDSKSGDDVVKATVSYNSYWSPFPESLPPIDEPIVGLTDEEKVLLNKLSKFEDPDVVTIPSPTEPGVRDNPFSLGI